MNRQLEHIAESALVMLPELILSISLLLILFTGLFLRKNRFITLKVITSASMILVAVVTLLTWPSEPVELFSSMLRADAFSAYFKILFLTGGLITAWITPKQEHPTEYFFLLASIVLGACLLAMSMNFITVLVTLELISLSSYLLAGFGFDKKSAEGSLKYFIFGSIASACMIYGLALIYGLAGTLYFNSENFISALMNHSSPLLLTGGLLTLAGFLFKVAAVPFHLWAPDVYESAPTPVVAFFSVVPKLAGLAIISKFALAMHLFGHSTYNWQLIFSVIAILTLLAGNLSALAQTDPKRMMAYSGVAQAGFLLVGVTTFTPEGIQFMIFYATVYLLMNFLVFHALQQFEILWGNQRIPSFSGMGTAMLIPSLAMLVGLVSLTGLPPTAGFSAKLFIFSSLWQSYQQSNDPLLMALFITGLLNTVISLFFYLKIPYYLFIKEAGVNYESIKTSRAGNLLSLILVILIVYFFINPGGLMGWINRITFAL
jgi:NADH-quinone oxidoreductase subunit N